MIRQKYRKFIEILLKGSHNHFLSYLPAQKGLISTWLLKLFFSGIKDDPQQLKVLETIPDDAIIIYLNKHKSYFDFLFYNSRWGDNRLCVPEIGFTYRIYIFQPIFRLLRAFLSKLDYFLLNWKLPDPYGDGYYREELLSGKCGFLSLVEKKGFYSRFVMAKTDPISFLLELQNETELPIYMVPQLMFFSKKPVRSVPSVMDILIGPETKPGPLRRLVILFQKPDRIFYEVSRPINLKDFLSDPEYGARPHDHQALLLRRNLLRQLNRHRQSITGPMKKTTEEIKESILTNPRLKSYMDEHAQKRNISLWKIRRKADAYLDEIACKQNAGLLRFAEVSVGWLLNTMFQGVSVNQEGLNHIKEISLKAPLIFVPCHKSHVDYLMLPYLMYKNNMPVPYIAAGKNLSFWPLGPIFRALGAFFLRRTFRGNVLYAKVFAEYIHKILEDGHNIKIFIEGTRSRTGKLIMPKIGFISILLNAYKNGACEDLIFAPIFIGYDRVLEEKSYLHEIEGGKKEPESFLQVLSARKLLKNRYGKIYIKFNEPISVNHLLSQNGMSLHEMRSKEQNAFSRNLGHRIINAINNVTVVTPHALVASAFLNLARKRPAYDDVLQLTETYLHHLSLLKVEISDTLLINHVLAVENVLEAYLSRKFVELTSDSKNSSLAESKFKVNVSKRPILEYYKNNCISFFVPAAFTSLAILDKDAFQFSAPDLHKRYAFLQDFFKYEFAFDVDRTPDHYLRKTIKAFIDDAILMPHRTLPDTYNVTAAGFRKLKRFCAFLKPCFESYWVVLSYFQKYPRNSTSSKERLKKIQSRGNKMYKNHEIDLIESLSKINYNNAINFFTTHEVKGSDDLQQIEFYRETIYNYLGHINS